MDTKPKRVIIDISWTALLRVLAVSLAVLSIIVLRDVIMMLVVVFIFVAAVNPTIRKMQESMSRTLAVALFFALLALVLAVISYAILPLVVGQLNDLAKQLPHIFRNLRDFYQSLTSSNTSLFQEASNTVSSNIQNLTQRVFDTTMTFFGGIATVVTGAVLSFYLLLEEKNAREFFYQIMPRNRFEPMYETVRKISDRMGSWIRGQLLLMLIIGIANFIVFVILQVPSPLPLAIWAGLMEALPYFGPVFGVIPAILVAYTAGGIVKALLVLVFAFGLIQQLEANFIVPRVMSKAVGLSPVLVIIAMIIGLKMFGLLGAIIAIPSAAIVSVVVEEWPNLKGMWEKSEEEAAQR